MSQMILLIWLLLISVTKTTKFVTYVNHINSWASYQEAARSLGVPTYAPNTIYQYFIFSFWMTDGTKDAAELFTNPLKYVYFGSDSQLGQEKEQIQKSIIKLFHDHNKTVLLSAFGSTDLPTTNQKKPNETCSALADFALQNKFDGVDIDYEDIKAFEQGLAEDWLIECTKAIRVKMPVGSYILTHAPMAPFFTTLKGYYKNGGYKKVHQEVGHLIDWYNVQFYNQMDNSYDTFQLLINQSKSMFIGTSLKEIIEQGIEKEKIILGKPISLVDINPKNTGIVKPNTLGKWASVAFRQLGWKAGFMTWQYRSDIDGNFANIIQKNFDFTNNTINIEDYSNAGLDEDNCNENDPNCYNSSDNEDL